MKKRILYIIDSLAIGGAEMLLVGLIDEALARGHTPFVAYFTPGPLLEDVAARGVETRRLSASGLRDPRAVLRAVRLMREWKPDVVHTHLVKSDLVGQIAARIAGAPIKVLSLHNVDPWRRRRSLSRIYRAATGGADHCIAVSQQVGDFGVESGSVRAEDVVVIGNGVDMRKFDAAAIAPLDVGRWGVPPDAPLLAVIGRLDPQKDHRTFLAAASIVAERAPHAHFLIVGDGPLRAELESLAAEMGLSPDRVHFTGIVRDMPALMRALDVVVFSSAWEGLPVTLLEAMAMGLPVASTAVGGVPDVLEDGVDGKLTPAGSPQALADAMIDLLTDDAARARIGAAAKRKAQDRFSAEAMLARTFSLYGDAPAAQC